MKRIEIEHLGAIIERDDQGTIRLTMGSACVLCGTAADALSLSDALVRVALSSAIYVPQPYPVDLENLEESPKLVVPKGGA